MKRMCPNNLSSLTKLMIPISFILSTVQALSIEVSFGASRTRTGLTIALYGASEQ